MLPGFDAVVRMQTLRGMPVVFEMPRFAHRPAHPPFYRLSANSLPAPRANVLLLFCATSIIFL